MSSGLFPCFAGGFRHVSVSVMYKLRSVPFRTQQLGKNSSVRHYQVDNPNNQKNNNFPNLFMTYCAATQCNIIIDSWTYALI